MKKYDLLFIYDVENPKLWNDGLYSAIKLLEKDFNVEWWNINGLHGQVDKEVTKPDFILGWGAFDSPVDNLLKTWMDPDPDKPSKKGLCLGGYSPANTIDTYDIIFYETEWSKKWLQAQNIKTPLLHAFGVNTSIFKPQKLTKLFDYLTIGAFAYWKRQELMNDKVGTKMAIGQIQKNNLGESVDIIGKLLLEHCAVSDSVPSEELARFINSSKKVYIPASEMGGGERSVLESRACGVDVEVAEDNLKLKELLSSPVWTAEYYAEQLKKGVLSCLN